MQVRDVLADDLGLRHEYGARGKRTIHLVQREWCLDAENVAQLLQLWTRTVAQHHVTDMEHVAWHRDMLRTVMHQSADDHAHGDVAQPWHLRQKHALHCRASN